MDFVFVSHIKSAGGPSHKISTELSSQPQSSAGWEGTDKVVL